jgi:hypothetical protein
LLKDHGAQHLQVGHQGVHLRNAGAIAIVVAEVGLLDQVLLRIGDVQPLQRLPNRVTLASIQPATANTAPDLAQRLQRAAASEISSGRQQPG